MSIKEIFSLCATNKTFASVCKIESLWKEKIWGQFGVKTKLKITWRATAEFLVRNKMIDLNKMWFDGRTTYRQLIESVLRTRGDERIRFAQIVSQAMQENMTFFNLGLFESYIYDSYAGDTAEELVFLDDGNENDWKELDAVSAMLTRELAILAGVVEAIDPPPPRFRKTSVTIDRGDWETYAAILSAIPGFERNEGYHEYLGLNIFSIPRISDVTEVSAENEEAAESEEAADSYGSEMNDEDLLWEDSM